MSFKRFFLVLFAAFAFGALSFPGDSFAAKKKKKKAKSKPFDSQVEYDGKTYTCVNGKPIKGGKLVDKNGEQQLRGGKALAKDKAKFKRQRANAKGKKARKRAQKKLKNFNSLLADVKALCAADDGEEGGPSVGAGSLQAYTGNFGFREAGIFGERFCGGFTPEQKARAVAEGLEATIQRYTTWVENATHNTWPGNPLISAMIEDLKCDAYLRGEEYDGEDDSNEDNCTPNNLYDFNIEGIKSRFMLEVTASDNCYFSVMQAFLADERTAPTLSAVSGQRRRYLAELYFNDLNRASRLGDYRKFIRDIFIPGNDGEGSGFSLIVLNGVGNKDNSSDQNEDGARELFELATTGTGPISAPLYGPIDIAQNALAFTGYVWTELTRSYVDPDDGDQVLIEYDAPGFSLPAFIAGDKVIFGNDPVNRSVISTLSDSVNASLNHSNTPFELARLICKRFLSSNCSPAAVNQIGTWLREDNLNFNRTMKRMMRASGNYTQTSSAKEALLKQPWEIASSALKAIGWPMGKEPLSMRKFESQWPNIIQRMGQRMFQPPTIFGFNERELASEPKVLDRRQSCYRLLVPDDPADLEENVGFSWRQRFMTNIPASEPSSLAVARKVFQAFNVEPSPAQLDVARSYLDFQWDSNCSSSDVSFGACTEDQLGQGYRRRDIFDHLNGENRYPERVQGLAVMVCQLPEFQTK